MNFYKKNIQYLLDNSKGNLPKNLSGSYSDHPTTDDLLILSAHFEVDLGVLLGRDLSRDFADKTAAIKLIVLDVDGVLTDGGMYYTESGDEFKKFNTKDGMAIKESVKKGMAFGIISSGINAGLIERRADLLGIGHVYVGKKSKMPILQEWCEKLKIGLNEVAYVGDDVNDLEVIANAGFTASPSDAITEVKMAVDVVLQSKGGEGCIREFMDRFFPFR